MAARSLPFFSVSPTPLSFYDLFCGYLKGLKLEALYDHKHLSKCVWCVKLS